MSYNNHRPPSPGGRRIQNAGRMSESILSDPYYQPRQGSYASPRSSGGVIPISTQTFVTTTPASAVRPEQRYDSYSGRPRRSSLVDTQRGTTGSATQLPSRTRPVVQQDYIRPASPSKNVRDKDYYVTSASSQEPRVTTSTHKKLYSVDDGGAKLVADVNIPAGGERHHKRRDSVERGSYSRPSGAERDHGRRGYHVNGAPSRPKDKSIDDDDAYSYTDPAAMYRETEPRWREARTRRGSLDRSGAPSRERPVSVIDPTFGIKAQNAKELGPPPSTRGWDKINDPGRVRTQRDVPREIAQSPTRGRTHQQEGYLDPRDQYYVPPRTNSTDRRANINNYDSYDYEDRMSRKPERRNSVSRDAHPDASIERRGFGIRRPESQTRHAGRDGRGSDESFTEQAKYRDSGYAEPHRRDTAPEYYPPDNARLEQEKRDRELAQRIQAEEHSRPRDRGYSDVRERERDYSKDARRREEDRAYMPGEYPRDRDYERDRERDRDRPRPAEPADRDRERHHHRRDTDRDRDYARKENSPRQSGETLNKSGLAATGVLGGAAAALGLSSILNRNSDKKDKDKERDDPQDRDRERSDRSERDREDRYERNDRRNGDDREPPRERKPAPASDENYNSDRDRPGRGLGFAFENAPEPPRSAPPIHSEWSQPPERKPDERRVDWGPPPPVNNSERGPEKQTQDRAPDRAQERPQERAQERPVDRPQERPAPRDFDRERERERDRDRDHGSKPVEQAGTVLDADEDYRRRMEQVQRELGLGPVDDPRNSDSDPDRERRRREREQRLRERERDGRNGTNAAASMESSFNEAPPHPALRHGFDDQSALGTAPSTTSTAQTDLRRKPSILDRPMTTEPAQIIDNSLSERRENRVRIVDPPSEEEERKPKGILKRPTEKFPEDPNAVREGVAPLKDASKKGIPPGARWTKIDRRLVNPEALEASHERFEERLDCVIVLRVLTKEEIQKLADKTRDIRDRRYEEEQREERKAARRNDRNHDRRDRDEFEYSDSEDEYKSKPPMMLEAPSTAGASQGSADFIRENQGRHEREREADPQYSMSGGLGSRREESQGRY